VAPARDLLAALGLLDLFAAIGGGDSYPVRKPDPAHLLATLAQAGGIASRAIMVGDHHNDVAAAAGAGMPAIFAAWGYGPASAGAHAAATAQSFADIPALAMALLD
jgi:phosphoglycolate phosphatase